MSQGDPLLSLLRCFTDFAARTARDFRHLERSARFLTGLREYVGKDDDVFVCSYPRSGTTWVQLLTHLIVRGGDLSFRHINAVVPWFERSLALGRLTAEDLAQLPAPRLYKSHLVPRWLPRRGRFIYVQRDGLDVALSYFAFYRSHLGFVGSQEDFFERFLSGKLQYRSWFDHVRNWEAHRHDPRVLFLQYERMREEPQATIVRMAEFLEVPLGAARVRHIAELSSLANMREHEALFDHAVEEQFQSQPSRGQFVRTGEVGSSRNQLSDAQRSRFAVRLQKGHRAPTLRDLPAFLH